MVLSFLSSHAPGQAQPQVRPGKFSDPFRQGPRRFQAEKLSPCGNLLWPVQNSSRQDRVGQGQAQAKEVPASPTNPLTVWMIELPKEVSATARVRSDWRRSPLRIPS